MLIQLTQQKTIISRSLNTFIFFSNIPTCRLFHRYKYLLVFYNAVLQLKLNFIIHIYFRFSVRYLSQLLEIQIDYPYLMSHIHTTINMTYDKIEQLEKKIRNIIFILKPFISNLDCILTNSAGSKSFFEKLVKTNKILCLAFKKIVFVMD